MDRINRGGGRIRLVEGGLGLTTTAEQGGGATETEEEDAARFWNGADDALRVQGEGGDVPSFAGWIIGSGGGAGAADNAVEVKIRGRSGSKRPLDTSGENTPEGGSVNRIEFIPAVDGGAFILQHATTTGA